MNVLSVREIVCVSVCVCVCVIICIYDATVSIFTDFTIYISISGMHMGTQILCLKTIPLKWTWLEVKGVTSSGQKEQC